MIFVLARNYMAAREWMHKHRLHENRDARYMRDYHALLGIERNKHHFVNLGGWDNYNSNPDMISMMYTQIKIAGLTELDNNILLEYTTLRVNENLK